MLFCGLVWRHSNWLIQIFQEASHNFINKILALYRLSTAPPIWPVIICGKQALGLKEQSLHKTDFEVNDAKELSSAWSFFQVSGIDGNMQLIYCFRSWIAHSWSRLILIELMRLTCILQKKVISNMFTNETA